MKLIILTLVALITWELYDRVEKKIPEWVETIKDWLGIKNPSAVYIDTCHAGYSPIENKRRFLRGLEDFCKTEGLDCVVSEDFMDDALHIRIWDKKTNKQQHTLVPRRSYEEAPSAQLEFIKRRWKAATCEKPGVEIQVPNEQREAVLQAVKDYAEKEGIKVVESKGKQREEQEPRLYVQMHRK